MMNDLRGIMSGIYTKAEEWGYWLEGRRNPMSRVKIERKGSVRPERILTEEQTVRVLACSVIPNLLFSKPPSSPARREEDGLRDHRTCQQAALGRYPQSSSRGFSSTIWQIPVSYGGNHHDIHESPKQMASGALCSLVRSRRSPDHG
jgi:hypothetical protein